MIKLEALKKLHNFEPAYAFSEVELNLPRDYDFKIKDSRLYKAVSRLTEKAHPTIEEKNDRRWLDFYLPLKRRGYFIVVPLGIVQYGDRYFVSLMHSSVEVDTGREKNDLFRGLIEQTRDFSLILKRDPGIVVKALPYDIRTGRILGKYVLQHLLPIDKKEELLKQYAKHLERGKRSEGASLDDYLRTAALCYSASFKTHGLTAEAMYRKFADGRDCGMLEIKNRKSKAAFRHWQNAEANCGGHPFEIVYSMIHHGIHLFPPLTERPYYILRVSNYEGYAMHFLEMVQALIRNSVPFEAHRLEHVLEYLTGESYFTVNAHGDHSIDYYPGERRLLKHIEWDDPPMLKWK